MCCETIERPCENVVTDDRLRKRATVDPPEEQEGITVCDISSLGRRKEHDRIEQYPGYYSMSTPQESWSAVMSVASSPS